ncbi:hypothetical protein SMMN14_01124 [Sphaerulina musiva]
MPSKKDDTEQHRAEIEQWTQDGQNCEQIAAALKARGVDISAKTISRHRVAWGIRQRAEPKTKGRKYPGRRRAAPPQQPSKHGLQEARKADIIARTQRGETAEQISDAFAAQGTPLSKSTLIRLQTFWGLIPYDPARARGKLSDAQKTKRTTREAAPKISRKPRKSTTVISAPANPAEVQHYPTTCAFGPVKGGTTTTTTTFIGTTTSQSPYEDEPAPPFDDESHMASSPLPPPQTPPAEHAEQPSVHHAVDIMSAEMLVDLATSTLAAANRVKELYVAQQSQRPVLGMTTIPTAEDIALAKQKVREAAAVMHDLATPNDT